MRPLPRALVVLLIATTLARCLFAGLLDLGQDEAYAFAVSRPFQLSFFDHPPLSFWIAGAMRTLFGDGVPPFLLRLPFVLMFTGSTWALFALTARFYGERAGLWAAGLLNVAPFFFASAGSWVVPDGPLILFSLLGAICFARAILDAPQASGHWRDWLLAGLFFGIALLSKYQAVLILLGALLYLLFTTRRIWLARPQPFVAAALVVLLFAAVLWWNAANNWISFGFQLGRGGGSHAVDLSRLSSLVVGEAVYAEPWILAALIVAAIRAWRGAGEGRLLLALAMPPILLFNLLPLVGPAGLPHWSMPGWLFLFPALGGLLASARKKGRKWPLLFGGLSAVVIVSMALAVVALGSNFRMFSGSPDLNHYLAEATSWTGVADGLRQQALLDRPNTFLAALNWQDGARVAEAVRPANPVVVFGDDPRGFAFLASPNTHLGEDALLVVRAEDAESATHFAEGYFDTVETIGTFATLKGGTPAFGNTVLLAHRLNKPVATPYGMH